MSGSLTFIWKNRFFNRPIPIDLSEAIPLHGFWWSSTLLRAELWDLKWAKIVPKKSSQVPRDSSQVIFLDQNCEGLWRMTNITYNTVVCISCMTDVGYFAALCFGGWREAIVSFQVLVRVTFDLQKHRRFFKYVFSGWSTLNARYGICVFFPWIIMLQEGHHYKQFEKKTFTTCQGTTPFYIASGW